jgi:hypothetical protein
VAKLSRVRHERNPDTRDVLPPQAPPAGNPDQASDADPVSDPAPVRNPGSAETADSVIKIISAGQQVRVRHTARHAPRHSRSSNGRPSRRPSLSIRSAEGRRWSADLTGPSGSGLVVYGMGGIGKSTLASQIATRLSQVRAERVVAFFDGEVSAASFAAAPAEADFLIFDNFDDNLSHESGQWTIRDPALAALLAKWTGKLLITCRHPFTLSPLAAAQPLAAAPPQAEARPLTAARPVTAAVALSEARAFSAAVAFSEAQASGTAQDSGTGQATLLPDVPRPAVDKLVFRQLGPLTRSGAEELTASLPAVGQLADAERDQVWRLTAGHPLAILYLDSLLTLDERYRDVAGRIEKLIEARTGRPLPGTEPTELPAATAEAIACAAADQLVGELFDRLGSGAKALLVRTSVFRLPVPPEVLAGRPGPIAECETAGLLTVGAGHELSVHRWTADALHRRLAQDGLGAQVAAAHRRAAGYWQAGAAGAPSGHRAQLEAGYHQRQATVGAAEPPALREPGSTAGPGARRVGSTRRRRVTRLGLAGAFGALAVALTVALTQGVSVPYLASSQPAAGTSATLSARVADAVALRGQAAAWAASQVSRGAVMACDPAMCAALVQHSVAAGNLLVLRPGTPDPLGSDVVLATAAVRAMFGFRLTSVYAPDVLASFGTGQARIDIRAVAPDGTAAYQAALAADVRARRQAGTQLLRDPRITFAPSAQAQLAAGQVDARLLTTLDTLAASEPVRIRAFSDSGPGASPGMPLRAAELSAVHGSAQNLLAFFRAQRSPYLAALASVAAGPGGGSMLTVEFTAPAPLGLLQPQSLPGRS